MNDYSNFFRQEEALYQEFLRMLERQTDKKIFTLRVLGEDKEKLNVLVIFRDKSVLDANISIVEAYGNVGFKIQGDFI